MSEDIFFLRAILNNPRDDTVRLVYADWLEERNDPRAEYLRLEVQRHHSPDERAELEKQMGNLSARLDQRWVYRMWDAREPAPNARQDLVTVADSKGLIEVRGQSEAVLLVEGKPVALNWDDLQGSVGQYLVFTGHTRGADYAHQLRKFVEGAPDGNQCLADRQESVQPAILRIDREEALEVSLNEGLGWLPPAHPGVPEYRRVKDYMLRLTTG